jgi:hypothetical protein
MTVGAGVVIDLAVISRLEFGSACIRTSLVPWFSGQHGAVGGAPDGLATE